MSKQQLKDLVDQLPDEKIVWLEKLLSNLLKHDNLKAPKGDLGLKQEFDRASFYDEILANRY